MKLAEKFKDTPVIGKFVSNPKLMELFRFAVAGAAGFVVDYAVYLVIIWIFGDGAYLWGKVLGFTISVFVNYLLCLYYVFEDAKKQSPAQIAVSRFFTCITPVKPMRLHRGSCFPRGQGRPETGKTAG